MSTEINTTTSADTTKTLNTENTQVTTTQKVKTRLVSPRVNIIENDEAFEITAELPGVRDEDIEVDIEKRVLTIRAKTALRDKEGFRKLYGHSLHKEYHADFRLSDDIDSEAIAANLSDGVLILTLQKKAPAKKRKIAIKVANPES